MYKEFKNWLRVSDSYNSKGVILPTEITKMMNEEMEKISFWRQHASIIKTSLQSVEIMSNKSGYKTQWLGDENTLQNTDFSEFKCRNIKNFEIYANPSVSSKLFDDEESNVEKTIIAQVTHSIVEEEIKSFLIGDGKDRPMGILKNKDIKTITKKEKLMESLIEMMCSLKNIYLNNAIWILNRKIMSDLYNEEFTKLLSMTSVNNKLITSLFGLPIYINENATSAILIDLKSTYLVVDQREMSLLKDPYSKKPMIEFYFSKRVGGDVVDPEGYVILGE